MHVLASFVSAVAIQLDCQHLCAYKPRKSVIYRKLLELNVCSSTWKKVSMNIEGWRSSRWGSTTSNNHLNHFIIYKMNIFLWSFDIFLIHIKHFIENTENVADSSSCSTVQCELKSAAWRKSIPSNKSSMSSQIIMLFRQNFTSYIVWSHIISQCQIVLHTHLCGSLWGKFYVWHFKRVWTVILQYYYWRRARTKIKHPKTESI